MANSRLGRAVLELATEGAQAILADLDKVKGGLKGVTSEAGGAGAKDLSNFDQALGGVNSALGRMALKLGVAGVALKAVDLVKDWTVAALEQADAVSNLAQRYRLSTDAVQEFQFIAKETGVEFGTIANSARNLSRFVAEGNDSAAAALNKLGLSFADLKGLSPDEMFYKVSARLADVADEGTQTSIAMDLFGKAGQDALGAINQGLDELQDKAPKAHQAAIDALDNLGDEWSRFMAGQRRDFQEWLGLWAVLLTEGPGKTLEVYREMAGEVPPKIKDITAQLKAQHEAGGLVEKEMEKISKELTTSIEKKTKANEAWIASLDKVTARGALKEAQDAIKQIAGAGDLAGLAPDRIKAFADTFERAAKAALQMGRIDLAKQFEATARALNPVVQFAQRWNIAINDFVTLNPSYSAAIDEQLSLYEKQADVLAFGILPSTFDWKQALDVLKPALTDTAHETKLTADEIEALERAAKRATTEGLRELADAFADLSQIAGETDFGHLLKDIGEIVGLMALVSEAVGRLEDGLDQIDAGNFTAGLSQMTASILSVVAAMERATSGTDRWKASIGGAITGFQVAGAAGGIFGFVLGWVRATEAAQEAARLAAMQFRADLKALTGEAQKLMAVANSLGAGKSLARMLETAKTQEDLQRIREELDRIRQEADDVGQEMAEFIDQIEAAGFAIPTNLEALFMNLPGNIPDAALKKLKEMLGVVGEMEVPWRKMQELAEKFGVDINSLGKNFQAAKFKDRAKELLDVWNALTQGAPEAQGGVLSGIKDEIQALVQDAQRLGFAIPENFRPLIQNLIDTKQLFAANGDLIEDIGQIRFGARIETEFDKIIKKIDELVDRFIHLFEVMNSVPKGDRGGPNDPGGGNRPPTDPNDVPTLPPPGDRFGPQGYSLNTTGVRALADAATFAPPTLTLPTAGPIALPSEGGRVTAPVIGGSVVVMPVLVPESADEEAIAAAIYQRFPLDFATDAERVRTRSMPAIVDGVRAALGARKR